ncbi:MAG: hypothetical protein FWD13_05990 [Treponema sp.]|nr:hypothetical protein [Treponema sp.]
MKSIVKLSGFIILIALIGFTFVSCPESGLSGTVSITGINWEGQTLTANTSNLGGSGVITFQWTRWTRNGSTVVGSNSSTYTVLCAMQNKY